MCVDDGNFFFLSIDVNFLNGIEGEEENFVLVFAALAVMIRKIISCYEVIGSNTEIVHCSLTTRFRVPEKYKKKLIIVSYFNNQVNFFFFFPRHRCRLNLITQMISYDVD